MISRSGFMAIPTVVTPPYRSGRSLVDWQIPTKSKSNRLQICTTAGEVATRRTSLLSFVLVVSSGCWLTQPVTHSAITPAKTRDRIFLSFIARTFPYFFRKGFLPFLKKQKYHTQPP